MIPIAGRITVALCVAAGLTVMHPSPLRWLLFACGEFNPDNPAAAGAHDR